MRSVIIIVLLLTASLAFAESQTTLYLLTRGDADSLYGGFQYALTKSPDYQAVDWRNPATGLNGSTIPIRSYQTSYGLLCREYVSTVQLDGATQQAFGTACQQVNGGWKIAGERVVDRSQAMKFVYLGQSLDRSINSCPFASSQQMKRRQLSPGENFHGDRFREQFRRLHKDAWPAPELRRVEPPHPSKLIKLVAY